MSLPQRSRVLMSWSSGKDCAWALHLLGQQTDLDVIGLLTTFNEAADRVAMHAVRRELVEAQAEAVGLPLWRVDLPWPCSNADYEERMSRLIAQAREAGVTHIGFGDLFLEDVRAYRIKQLAGTGIEPLFPIWRSRDETRTLAHEMLAAGVKAILTCVDPKQLDPVFTGRTWDARLLEELPSSVDPCGENGEFHTFCWDGPVFRRPVAVHSGPVVERDGFWFADLLPAPISAGGSSSAKAGCS
jgi:uncharacterized protein (TIGR00290 family)